MDQLYLGAPGFAGIYRETFRVLLRAILPNKGGRGAANLSALVLAHIASNWAFLSLLDGTDPVPDVVTFAYTLCTAVLVLLLLICGAAFVFRAGSPYRIDGYSGACDLILRNIPRAPLKRLVGMFLHVAPLAIAYGLFTIAVCLVLLLLDPAVMLPMRVIGGTACLAGAVYASVVLHITCVVLVLEHDHPPLGVLRRSRALLVGKFWAAAAVFVPLDCSLGTLLVSLLLLTTEGAGGLGRGFQVAAGAAMAVALWWVVVVTVAAQPVVYLVCKNHHHEVVDSGVKLQAVGSRSLKV